MSLAANSLLAASDPSGDRQTPVDMCRVRHTLAAPPELQPRRRERRERLGLGFARLRVALVALDWVVLALRPSAAASVSSSCILCESIWRRNDSSLPFTHVYTASICGEHTPPALACSQWQCLSLLVATVRWCSTCGVRPQRRSARAALFNWVSPAAPADWRDDCCVRSTTCTSHCHRMLYTPRALAYAMVLVISSPSSERSIGRGHCMHWILIGCCECVRTTGYRFGEAPSSDMSHPSTRRKGDTGEGNPPAVRW
jgi:hypothetical protein